MLLPLALTASLFATSHGLAGTACRRMIGTTDPIITARDVTSAVYGDFDEDGRVDVAVMIDYDERIINLNRGAVFEPLPMERLYTETSMGFSARLVAATDIDRDGHLDLVYRYNDTVWTAFGRGNGTFAKAIQRSLPGSTASEYRVLDFDHDGVVDFVDSELSHSQVVFEKSNPDGTFTDVAHVALSIYPGVSSGYVTVGDFDGDGQVDLWRQSNGMVTIGWNDGTFHFKETWEVMKLPALTPLDVDGDGAEELVGLEDGMLVMVRAKDRHLHVQRFPVAAPGVSQYLGGTASADVDGDGLRDFVFQRAGALGVVRATPDGGFGAAEYFALPGSDGLVAVDVNGDGFVDFAPASGKQGLRVLDGASLAAGHPNANRFYPSAQAVAVALADVDGDGRRDLILSNADVTVFFGDGHGLFPRIAKQQLSNLRAAPVIDDFDGDGRADLAGVSNDTAATKYIAFGSSDGFGSPSLTIDADAIYGRVAGTASSAPALVARKGDALQLITVSAGRLLSSTTLTHVAANAAISIAATQPEVAPQILVDEPNGTRVLESTPAGWHERPVTLSRHGFYGLTAADFDRDGHIDLAGCESGLLGLLRANGSSYELRPLPPIISASLAAAVAADVDGDGWPDLVMTGRNNYGDPGLAQVVRNAGNGTFQSYAVALTSSPSFAPPLVDDVDGDDRPDIIVPGFWGAEVMLNTCASPRLALEAVVHERSVKIVIHAFSADTFAGPVTISENGVELAFRALTYGDSPATMVWTSPSLPAGHHTFRIKYADPYAEAYETTVDVEIPTTPPRRRAVRH